MPSHRAGRENTNLQRKAVRFVLIIGVLSFFADFTYEGSRSVLGPYLAALGASGAMVGIVTGFGELLGYSLRLASGRAADRTGQFWPITIFGYALQMSSVPALAFTHSWPEAAALIVAERVGKAIRNPPRDVMLSHAAKRIGGYGWAFGLHEAFDQFGALFGPLLVALVLAHRGSYQLAFAILLLPAVINLLLVGAARLAYPRPQDLEAEAPRSQATGLSRVYWLYLAGAGLVAAGFADYPLVAYHLARSQAVPGEWIAVFYSVAMAVSGAGSLLFGRLFDRFGFKVLLILTTLSIGFAPLVFLGGFWMAFAGIGLWGLGMGVHESIIPAAVTPLVVEKRRASAFGLFTAGYGVSWFIGSAILGLLYDRSLYATVAFSVGCEIAALPILVVVARRHPRA